MAASLHLDEKTVRLTLGPYPRLSLIEARAKVNKNQEWLDEGIDPRRAQPKGSRARLPLLPALIEAGSSGVQPEVLPPNWPTDRFSSGLLQALTPLPECSLSQPRSHTVATVQPPMFYTFLSAEGVPEEIVSWNREINAARDNPDEMSNIRVPNCSMAIPKRKGATAWPIRPGAEILPMRAP